MIRNPKNTRQPLTNLVTGYWYSRKPALVWNMGFPGMKSLSWNNPTWGIGNGGIFENSPGTGDGSLASTWTYNDNTRSDTTVLIVVESVSGGTGYFAGDTTDNRAFSTAGGTGGVWSYYNGTGQQNCGGVLKAGEPTGIILTFPAVSGGTGKAFTAGRQTAGSVNIGTGTTSVFNIRRVHGIGVNVKFYLVAGFDTLLSEAECIELTKNPWQLFLEQRRRIYFGAGAGGTAYTLTTATGTFTETGNAASLLKGSVVLTTTGSFTETGNAANLVKTSVLATATGAFTETGNAANLTKQWSLVADVGSFVFTGNDATLSYSGNVHPPLTAATGSYTLTGNTVGLAHGYVLATATGTFTETGNSVALKKGNSVTTATGAFTLTGNDSALVKTYVLTTEKGTFILTGRTANLIWSGAPGVSVTFWTGVSKMNNSESSGGVSEKSHDISGGPSVYTVTETSAVSSDKKDSVSYVGYDHA